MSPILCHQFEISQDKIHRSKETDVCVKIDLRYVVQNSSSLPKCLSLIPHIKKDLMINFKYLKRTIVTFKKQTFAPLKQDLCYCRKRPIAHLSFMNLSKIICARQKRHMSTSKETHTCVKKNTFHRSLHFTHEIKSSYLNFIWHILQRLIYKGMGWLRLVGSLKLQVFFAKEPYQKDYILRKRPIILRRLLIVTTPYVQTSRCLSNVFFCFSCSLKFLLEWA